MRHRLHFIENGRRDWGAFHSAAGTDPVLAEGRELAELLSAEHDIVWLSGRPEWLRPLTEAWLDEHGLPAGPVVLRGNYDHRPAATFKLGVVRALAEHDVVAAVVDDDDLVIDALTGAGFPGGAGRLAAPHPRRRAASGTRCGRRILKALSRFANSGPRRGGYV